METKMIISLIIGALGVNHGYTNAQLADSPWPMFHGGPQHGGLSVYDTSHIDGTIKWKLNIKFKVKTDPFIEASPVIAKDGTIYIATHDSNLYAVSPDGKLKWEFDAGNPVYNEQYNVWKGILSTPAVAEDGTIYFTTLANLLFALYQDGTEKWRFSLPVSDEFGWTSPVIGQDGTIYVSSARDYRGRAGLYAINPDGTLKWLFRHDNGGASSPAIAKDGTIYASGFVSVDPKRGKGNGKLYAINPDGTERWEFTFEDWQESHPAIASDGTIYIGSKKGKLYAINPDGTEKWSYQTGGSISASPAISSDGTIYVGSWDAYFYALTPEGELKWKFKTPPGYEALSSGAAIGSEGTIYFTSLNTGELYALNPDGTERWRFKPSLFSRGMAPVTPAIGADGTLYVAGNDRKLYAFGGSNKNLKKTTRETIKMPEAQLKKSEERPIEKKLIQSKSTVGAKDKEKEMGVIDSISEKFIIPIFIFFKSLLKLFGL
jgi:outer membrane protein assembly factor BamB